jgi:hypothetical protein
LERIPREGQINVLTQPVGVSAKVVVNLFANFPDSPLILDGIKRHPQLPDCRCGMARVLDIMIEHNTAGSHGYQQIAQFRFHHTDSRLRSADALQRLIELIARTNQ